MRKKDWFFRVMTRAEQIAEEENNEREKSAEQMEQEKRFDELNDEIHRIASRILEDQFHC
jgi:hypothetical protein